jgi:hypothetical protein
LVLHTWDSRLTSTCPSLSYGRLFLQSWPWILISLLEDCLCSHARTSSARLQRRGQGSSPRVTLWLPSSFNSSGIAPRQTQAKGTIDSLLQVYTRAAFVGRGPSESQALKGQRFAGSCSPG